MVEQLLMQRIREVLRRITASTPRPNPLRLGSAVSWRTSDLPAPTSARQPPPDVAALWACCDGAELFKDQDYGQWGLELLAQGKSAYLSDYFIKNRPRDFKTGDVVIGAFIGDQDLLVVAPSETGSRRILIALPIYERSEWYGVGSDLASFLEDYLAREGAKYWDPMQ